MIFKDILEPLIVPSFLEVFKKQCLDAEGTFEILVDEEFPESSIVAHHRFCLFQSPEKSFALPIYADAMARASLRSEPSCAPRPGHGVDPRVLNYFDINVVVDTSFPSDCSDSGCSSKAGDIYDYYSDGSRSS